MPRPAVATPHRPLAPAPLRALAATVDAEHLLGLLAGGLRADTLDAITRLALVWHPDPRILPALLDHLARPSATTTPALLWDCWDRAVADAIERGEPWSPALARIVSQIEGLRSSGLERRRTIWEIPLDDRPPHRRSPREHLAALATWLATAPDAERGQSIADPDLGLLELRARHDPHLPVHAARAAASLHYDALAANAALDATPTGDAMLADARRWLHRRAPAASASVIAAPLLCARLDRGWRPEPDDARALRDLADAMARGPDDPATSLSARALVLHPSLALPWGQTLELAARFVATPFADALPWHYLWAQPTLATANPADSAATLLRRSAHPSQPAVIAALAHSPLAHDPAAVQVIADQALASGSRGALAPLLTAWPDARSAVVATLMLDRAWGPADLVWLLDAVPRPTLATWPTAVRARLLSHPDSGMREAMARRLGPATAAPARRL